MGGGELRGSDQVDEGMLEAWVRENEGVKDLKCDEYLTTGPSSTREKCLQTR